MTSSDPVSPVVEHLAQDSGLGPDIVEMAAKVGVPLSFDLLRMRPADARVEMARRITSALLAKSPNRI